MYSQATCQSNTVAEAELSRFKRSRAFTRLAGSCESIAYTSTFVSMASMQVVSREAKPTGVEGPLVGALQKLGKRCLRLRHGRFGCADRHLSLAGRKANSIGRLDRAVGQHLAGESNGRHRMDSPRDTKDLGHCTARRGVRPPCRSVGCRSVGDDVFPATISSMEARRKGTRNRVFGRSPAKRPASPAKAGRCCWLFVTGPFATGGTPVPRRDAGATGGDTPTYVGVIP